MNKLTIENFVSLMQDEENIEKIASTEENKKEVQTYRCYDYDFEEELDAIRSIN